MVDKILAKAVAENKNVYVFAHVLPDGDAICSASALVEYFNNHGVKSQYIITKKLYNFLGMTGRLDSTNEIDSNHISVILDTSTVGYSENELFKKSSNEDIYVIDHHMKMDNSVCIEDELQLPENHVIRNSNASSTCEILVNEMTLEKMTPKIANLLTVGLLTDTANLKYLKDDTLQNLITLINCGADFQKLIKLLAKKKSNLREEVALSKLFLNIQPFLIGDTFGLILPIDHKQVKSLNAYFKTNTLRKKINKMQDIEDCSFTCMIIENSSNIYDIQFRSSSLYGDFNVAQLASIYNGGGHHNAAGCSIELKNGLNTKSLISHIKIKAHSLFEKNGKTVEPFHQSEKDLILGEILNDTNNLMEGVTPDILESVDKLIKNGAHYNYVARKTKTIEQFMLQNELLSRVSSRDLAKKVPNVSISLTDADTAYLTQTYGVEEEDILDSISVFRNILIEGAKITLPNGKESYIDAVGNITKNCSKKI